MGTVVGLTFLLGFGDVLDLALRLGVPVWVAPLVAPRWTCRSWDYSRVLATWWFRGLNWTRCAALRLLVFASFLTLALNVADPLIRRQFGKAAFDAVGPLLLIGWSEVGPSLLHALSASISANSTDSPEVLTVARQRDRLAVDEFCVELEIARSTFYDRRAKAAKVIKLPNGRVLIRRAEFERWLNALEVA